MSKPNVLVLFTDDQRFDTIHALGNEDIITPNMDKLVQNGTSFTHAHIPGGTCGAVCMPSRAMLNTGRTLFSLQEQGQGIPADHALMGEVFKDNGYQTFGTGKWHNSAKSYARSFTCGDNIFFGGMHDHWSVPVHSFAPDGNYNGRIRKVIDWNKVNGAHQHVADKINAGVHSTDFLAEGLLNFLDEEHKEPFYAYTAFLAPHDPRTMPDEFRKMYDPAKIKLPANFQNYHHIEYEQWDCRDEVLAPYPRTAANTKKQIAEYYAMITHLDYQIGRVLDKLEEKGLKDNTIIILAGDNGLAVGQHGLFGKQNLYDHSVRVPLVFCGAGIPAGKQTDALVYLSDIFPTLCDMLGFNTPDSVNCPSFAPALKGEKDSAREHLYLAYTDKIRAVKKDNYKYMEHRFDGCVTKNLFNLNNDPIEVENIVNRAENQTLVKELQALMEQESKKSGELDQPLGKTYWGV